MLIAARDEDGTAGVFLVCSENSLTLYAHGGWVCSGSGNMKLLTGLAAEPFCRDIPPGEKRVIDLAKSTIVHVQPKKTAVQELVEKLDIAFKGVCRDDLMITGSVGIDNKKAGDVFDALARVRQEEQ